jgi:hypothetical protein
MQPLAQSQRKLALSATFQLKHRAAKVRNTSEMLIKSTFRSPLNQRKNSQKLS